MVCCLIHQPKVIVICHEIADNVFGHLNRLSIVERYESFYVYMVVKINFFICTVLQSVTSVHGSGHYCSEYPWISVCYLSALIRALLQRVSVDFSLLPQCMDPGITAAGIRWIHPWTTVCCLSVWIRALLQRVSVYCSLLLQCMDPGITAACVRLLQSVTSVYGSGHYCSWY